MNTRRLAFDARQFADAVLAEAVVRGKNCSEVARDCRVSKSTISRMKTHGRRPEVCSAVALAAWANLDLAEFVRHRNP
jgi:transcriptional regulator with XRE-family HTH domain